MRRHVCTTRSSSARDAPVVDSDAPGPEGLSGLIGRQATFRATPLSAHHWPHGAEIMDRWGLLDRLAATGCPPVALNLTFDWPVRAERRRDRRERGRGGFCPRRTVLDKLLVDAAVEAGTELREGFSVETRSGTAIESRESRATANGRHHRGAGTSRDRR